MRPGRRSLESLGHTYTAATSAAALLAGSCMPSWAEERRRPGSAPGRRVASHRPYKGSAPSLSEVPPPGDLSDPPALPRHSPKGGGSQRSE